ncbi:hypothetical protein [Bacillus solitudinis]|uniref:hypothetical protein n=1 Tax=Bacillus solitudinis TaxID=2014074 RepID=UPI000C23AD2E|nr:hypothetical protein [Bacillus solitudinis]
MKKFTPKSISHFFLELRIQDFYSYLSFMEDHIESHNLTLNNEYDKLSNELDDPNEKQELFEYMFLDRYDDLNNTYALILRKSSFLSLYSFFENELRSTAVKLEMQKINKIKLADLSHKGLYKYLFFIENVLNIELNLSKETRKKFQCFNTLRNYFVHNDGSPIKQKQFNELNLLKGVTFTELKINELYYVDSLSKEFNENYLDLINSFFGILIQSLESFNTDNID